MIIAGIAAAVIIVPIAIVLALGSRLPVAHRARASATYGRPVPEVWNVLTAFEEHPAWRRDLKAVERVADPAGEKVREISTKGEAMTFETTEHPSEHRLVRRIADKGLPFGGSWTFEITPQDGGSHVTITEDGEVYNLVFRFVSKYIIGHHATIKAFLEDLGGKFGEETSVAIE